jgi:beta-glucosidase/6-phospho-beta-glucosidase/beta-galactosidase
MNELTLGPRPEDFIWASGIEDTFVPQTRPGHRALDEYQLMGHYAHWREDLALLRDLGVGAVRWGVPWYRVEPLPGEFDWRWTDQVIPYLVEELGVTPIIDLMHYGCPYWLRREFAAEEYPAAVAAYAAAFARRYAGRVRWYTPLNEPLVNALMCGKRGLWPPYLRGDRGDIRIMLQLVRGILRTVAAIKAIDPQAIMVHVEATGISQAMHDELQGLATEDQYRGYLSCDLLTGRVDADHPLYPWLLQNGATAGDLAALARQAIPLDVVGMNFYPQWSTKEVYRDARGRVMRRVSERTGAGFADLIRNFHARYQAPILITETSAKDSETARAAWLAASVAAVKQVRAEGVPVLGYTWFPLFTMIDWRYRFGRGPLEQYRIELGLYRLAPAGGRTRWQATPLVPQFQQYVNDPAAAIGPLAVPTTAEPASAAYRG